MAFYLCHGEGGRWSEGGRDLLQEDGRKIWENNIENVKCVEILLNKPLVWNYGCVHGTSFSYKVRAFGAVLGKTNQLK